jgi:hypothetical protein
MKILAYILCVVVLALSVMPCIDEHSDNTLQKIELTQSTNTSNHQSDTDHCSPFCTCQCCQANFTVSNPLTIFSSTQLGIIYFEYTPGFQSLDLFDFLIPPKS